MARGAWLNCGLARAQIAPDRWRLELALLFAAEQRATQARSIIEPRRAGRTQARLAHTVARLAHTVGQRAPFVESELICNFRPIAARGAISAPRVPWALWHFGVLVLSPTRDRRRPKSSRRPEGSSLRSAGPRPKLQAPDTSATRARPIMERLPPEVGRSISLAESVGRRLRSGGRGVVAEELWQRSSSGAACASAEGGPARGCGTRAPSPRVLQAVCG